MNHSYSSHIFMFPFSLQDCGSHKEIVDSLLRSLWKRDKFEYQKGNYAANYSLQAYFYEFSIGAIIDDGTEYGVIESYCKEIGNDATYIIQIPATKDCEAKQYDLDIEKISLNIYDGKVAILSFHLENRKYSDFQDVLKINDLGRRIYPLYMRMDNNNKEVDLMGTKGQVLPDCIILDINGVLLKEDFVGYTKMNEHPFVLPKFISGILPNCMQNVHWLLDDRMFVVSWYGNDDLSERLKLSFSMDDLISSCKDGSPQLEDYYDWYKYVHNFKKHGRTIGYERLATLLKETTYDRWASTGTLYGVSRYSFVCLTDSKHGYNMGRRFMKSMYYYMAALCLAQRTMILYFTNVITEFTGKLNISAVQTDDIFNQIKALNLDLIRFNNNIYFREVTTQQQGIDIYNMLQKHMEVEIDRKELNEEVAQLYQYVNMAGDQKRTEKAHFLNLMAAIVLPFTIVTGFFGMNNFSEIIGNPGSWIECGIGFVFCIIAIIWLRKKNKK